MKALGEWQLVVKRYSPARLEVRVEGRCAQCTLRIVDASEYRTIVLDLREELLKRLGGRLGRWRLRRVVLVAAHHSTILARLNRRLTIEALRTIDRRRAQLAVHTTDCFAPRHATHLTTRRATRLATLSVGRKRQRLASTPGTLAQLAQLILQLE